MTDDAPIIEPLLDAAISMNTMFINLRDAGFTEQQALYLVGQMLRPIAEGTP